MPSLYTNDAVILPPNADAVRGADAIAQYWQDFELGITDARPVTLEVIPMAEYALEVGEYSVYGASPRPPGPRKDHGPLEERQWRMENAPRHVEQQYPHSQLTHQQTKSWS